MKSIEDVIAFAAISHNGQTDKDGVPYIYHPLHVMNSFPVKATEERMVAMLHDVVEDTSCTIKDLEDLACPPRVVSAVDAISKRKGEKYKEYLARVKENELATKVKLKDIQHNLDRSLANLFNYKDEKDKKKAQARVDKYKGAAIYLLKEE